MKIKTTNKSNISKERIAALEELLSDRPVSYYSSPGVYVRSDKDRELDILWQGFKLNSREERSPGVYLTIGFITGAVCMFFMSTVLNLGNVSHESFIDLKLWKKGNTESKVPISITPASKSVNLNKTEKYEIQNGDTLGKIVIRFYGSYTPEKVQQIQKANKLTNPNQLTVGKELIIPTQN